MFSVYVEAIMDSEMKSEINSGSGYVRAVFRIPEGKFESIPTLQVIGKFSLILGF